MLACIQPHKDPHCQPILPAAAAAAVATLPPHTNAHGTSIYNTQNDLLLHKVLRFYNENNSENMERMLSVINGTTNISLRIMDWFVTNYSKKHYTVYDLIGATGTGTGGGGTSIPAKRFKVYVDYKLKLRAYSKKRFDPFCRWDRINVPYKNGTYIQTTLGQLNFFKWAIENEVIRYIQENYSAIEADMNIRNNTSRKIAKSHQTSSTTIDGCELKIPDAPLESSSSVTPAAAEAAVTAKQRKKREELSDSATRSIKKEFVNIVLTFD
jgi:hypothetical protein